MVDENKDLVDQITRGFSAINDRISTRDNKVETLTENMIRMEGKLDLLKETLANKAETDKIANRVDQLEKTNEKLEKRQNENSNRLKGVFVSIALMLLLYLLNSLRIGFK